MRVFTLLILMTYVLNASSYMAKIEAYSFTKIKAQVTGIVSYVNKEKEFSYINKVTDIVKFGQKEENIELENLKKSLKIQSDILNIHQKNFRNKQKIKNISEYIKNKEKLNVLNSKQVIADLKKSIESTEDNKQKKVFSVNQMYLKEIYVNKDEYVDVGQTIYDLYDFTKLKLVLYVRAKDITHIKDKLVYIDGNKSDFLIEKISKIKDLNRVSTYKVILSKLNNINEQMNFGKVVKVDFNNM